jgi:hypothetical protein
MLKAKTTDLKAINESEQSEGLLKECGKGLIDVLKAGEMIGIGEVSTRASKTCGVIFLVRIMDRAIREPKGRPWCISS